MNVAVLVEHRGGAVAGPTLEALTLARTLGTPVAVWLGDTPSDDREEIVKGFSSGYYQILITNVQKGLNFQNCDNVIFFEFPSVGRAIQVEGRMTRSENIENKHVFVLLYDKNETPAFKGILSDRGKALDTFASTDYSMVLNLLLEQQSKG